MAKIFISKRSDKIITCSKFNKTLDHYGEILIQSALDDIRNVPDYSDFSLHMLYVIAKLRLQLKAREENLFASEKWSIPKCKDELIKKIEEFLIKNVK